MPIETERVAADIISQILKVAGFSVRRVERIIAVLRAIRRINSIYNLKNCTLSLDFKGLCALYTNIINLGPSSIDANIEENSYYIDEVSISGCCFEPEVVSLGEVIEKCSE